MSAEEHSGRIANESAREQRYSAALEERARSRQRLANQSVNNTLTTSVNESGPRDGHFVGRVAFPGPQDYMDGISDFYVGTAQYSGEEYVVFNWTTRVAACTYYRQRVDNDELQALSSAVTGVRVFVRDSSKIRDFEDEILDLSVDGDVFPVESLAVPRAPGRQAPPTSVLVSDGAPRIDSSHLADAPLQVPLSGNSAEPKDSSGISESSAAPGPPLRTPELLRRELAAPKAVSMSSVLSTLQTDQYEVIAKLASETQFLQGHPGTGKTIIAAHRAAFMLNSQVSADLRPRGTVLVLGPTDEYVAHISTALNRLIDRSGLYAVRSMPSLLDELARVPSSANPTQSITYEDVSPELARLIDKAFVRAKFGLTENSRPTRETVFEALVDFLRDPPPPALEAEWVAYLRDSQLPRAYSELQRLRPRRYRGMMAYIGALVDGRSQQIGHVIVDEAQDIHPIEWETLGRLGNSGGWTILGDLNQRRTDHTYNSWDDVALALALEDETGRAPVKVLERGYRSTSQIIRFANQLLRKEDRLLYSLQQDGEEPRICRVLSKNELIRKAVEEADSLSRKSGTGSTALIGMDTEAVRRYLLSHKWSADPTESSTWLQDGRSLRLLPPDRARGLEFDGVVVLEPADFPENFGRQGVLYTALTRANRFLTVVYHRALPGGMKARQ